MPRNEDEVVIAFVPSLAATLLKAEDEKGEPLTPEEVLAIRNEASCVAATPAEARKLEEQRGYRDLDPQNCWYEFQQLRRQMGRKPDLDPGPRTQQIADRDPEYGRALEAASASLDTFRAFLPADGEPRAGAFVKTRIQDEGRGVFLWLWEVRRAADGFRAQVFEVPGGVTAVSVGDVLEIPAARVTDWMVNERGTLHGGFTTRLQRSRLPEAERAGFDANLGIKRYAPLEDGA